jgi:phosphate transport system protein
MRHFEIELDKLRTSLIRMGSLVDEQIDYAISALMTSNMELAKLVIERDNKVDAFDNEIDRQCESIFARTQPVAIDLRLLMSALKINNELERIGDIAVNIAERIEPLFQWKQLLFGIPITEMADHAREMVKGAIDSFVNNDPELARNICAMDDIVDELDRNIFYQLLDQMKSDPGIIEPTVHLMMVTRHLERLADHATNIAEDVVFLVDAKIIKHGGEGDTPGEYGAEDNNH